MTERKTAAEPLFHIVKREGVSIKKKLIIYASTILISLIFTGIFCAVTAEDSGNPFDIFTSLFSGVFGTERRFWIFARETAILLGVSLAILPAFKMKFWNLGANGQILIGCLVCTTLMLKLGTKVSSGILVPLMVLCSVLAGAIWAVIPAIFKAFFNTNESLFTLMMNYIAEGLVIVAITVWVPSGSGSLSPIETVTIPDIINPYMLSIVVVAILTVFITFYMNKSKHGYELSVVGESQKTAKYVGINVNRVIIRTLALSGAICGLIGLILSGNINHTVNSTMHSNMGFTAIMTAWLANFNPIVLIGTTTLITFISRGMIQARKDFGFYNDAIANVAMGIIYFFIISSEFFINYKIVFHKKQNRSSAKAALSGDAVKTESNKGEKV